MIALPGRCQGCGTDVVWNGKRWRNVGQRSGGHVCPTDRPECGYTMPITRERCARRPGHRNSHRSRWVLDEEARRRRGEGYISPHYADTIRVTGVRRQSSARQEAVMREGLSPSRSRILAE